MSNPAEIPVTDEPLTENAPAPPTLTDNQRLGRLGEQLAAAHLIRSGWQIVDRNWRCRDGELDIVATEGGSLVACEVKTRISLRAGAPVEAVTPRKARRLRGLAAAWLAERGGVADAIRVDVIGVSIATDGTPTLVHVRGAA